MRKFRRALCCLLSLAILLSAVSLQHEAAQAEETGSRVIVSLGDSYSSGEGIPPFYHQDDPYDVKEYNESWVAHRSMFSWPGMLSLPGVGMMAENKDIDWYFVASSGARIQDLYNYQDNRVVKKSMFSWHTLPITPQLWIFGQLGEENKPDYVTITLGGNDADFADIIRTAAANISIINIDYLKDKVEAVWTRFNAPGGTRDRLKQAYRDIWEKAGKQCSIIVVGYPGLLSQDGGGALFSAEEARYINAQVSLFNKELRSIVAECYMEGIPIYFVSVEEDFYGHEAYTDEPYINGLVFNTVLSPTEDIDKTNPVSAYSIHPNYKGACVYARCVQKAIDYLEELKALGLEMPKYDAFADEYKAMIIENARRLLEEENPEEYTTIREYMRYVQDKKLELIRGLGKAELAYNEDDFAREWISIFVDSLISAFIHDVNTWKEAGIELGKTAGKGTLEEISLLLESGGEGNPLLEFIDKAYGSFSSKTPRDIMQALAVNATSSIVIDLNDIQSRMTDGRFGSFDDAVAFIQIHQKNKMYFATAQMGISLSEDEESRHDINTTLAATIELLFKKVRTIEMSTDIEFLQGAIIYRITYPSLSKTLQLLLDWLVENCYSQYTVDWKNELLAIEDETKQFFLRISNPGRDTPAQYLSEILPSSFERYEENEGDTCVFNLDRQGLPGINNEYYRNGNAGVNGELFGNGFEVWMARWNDAAEKSWVRTEYLLGGRYIYLSGKTGLIRSYNTADFDTTISFYGDGKLLDSYHMTPDHYEYPIGIDLTGVQKLTLYVEDNKAVKGGTSFALAQLGLTAVGEIPPQGMSGRVKNNDDEEADDSAYAKYYLTEKEARKKGGFYYVSNGNYLPLDYQAANKMFLQRTFSFAIFEEYPIPTISRNGKIVYFSDRNTDYLRVEPVNESGYTVGLSPDSEWFDDLYRDWGDEYLETGEYKRQSQYQYKVAESSFGAGQELSKSVYNDYNYLPLNKGDKVRFGWYTGTQYNEKILTANIRYYTYGKYSKGAFWHGNDPIKGTLTKDGYATYDISSYEPGLYKLGSYDSTMGLFRIADTEVLPEAETAWQEIYLPPDQNGNVTIWSIDGEEVDKQPEGTIISRYTFRSDNGKEPYRITVSKPEIPQRLVQKLKERNETWALVTYEETGRDHDRIMLYVFPRPTSGALLGLYSWRESRVTGFGEAMDCKSWFLYWSENYFVGMAYDYPGLEFDFVRDDQPSMYSLVTETYFPIPDAYVDLVLKCLKEPYSDSTVYAD